jgi:hypothetical protein
VNDFEQLDNDFHQLVKREIIATGIQRGIKGSSHSLYPNSNDFSLDKLVEIIHKQVKIKQIRIQIKETSWNALTSEL